MHFLYSLRSAVLLGAGSSLSASKSFGVRARKGFARLREEYDMWWLVESVKRVGVESYRAGGFSEHARCESDTEMCLSFINLRIVRYVLVSTQSVLI